MDAYYRPLICPDPSPLPGALPLAGGPLSFAFVERLARGAAPRVLPAAKLPPDWRAALTAPRAPVAGMALDAPRLMGILNVTPDSFSDGGRFAAAGSAVAHGRALIAGGADILDVGGESTRPGAAEMPAEEEAARVLPVIRALSDAACPISIDTRKRAVAEAAVAAGAALVNDVSGLTHDPGLAGYCAKAELPVCVMHIRGRPEDMQRDPRYDDVLLDVYDWLADRVAALETTGIPRGRILVDPGIGFGKTVDHNLALLRGVALFHGLGCPVLVGASRKGFIGVISGEQEAARRMPGSVAVALAAAAQGVQVLRIHDVAETRAALSLWQAVRQGQQNGT
ncbi:dihydropteroate synthase [Roseivivax sp. CAU 1761]